MNRKFTDEEIKELEERDEKLAASDQLYCNYKARKAIRHNETWDQLEAFGANFRVINQNTFEFWFNNRKVFYYATSNKWKIDNSKIIYRCRDLNHVIEILSTPYEERKK